MGWLDHCISVFDGNPAFVGKMEPGLVPLVPISHTTQKVNIEVALTGKGDFIRARVLRPDEMTTIIPCTEKSSARTSGLAPHPLFDKLQYIAGDYVQYGGEKKKFDYEEYMKNLQDWCSSPYAHPYVQAVYTYLQKKCLIHDLSEYKILPLNQDGSLMKNWKGGKENAPSIFQNMKKNETAFDSFVRFSVNEVRLCDDPDVWKSFQDYMEEELQKEDYCYAEGKKTKISELSPYKVRNAGDRAKLISSNDTTNFTFRGRFLTAGEAMAIGYEATQKAHSALRWLISRQGTPYEEEIILTWGMGNEPLPSSQSDTLDMVQQGWDEFGFDRNDAAAVTKTEESFAKAFNKVIQGYKERIPANASISVIALDAAVPGRLAIRYYRELQGSRFLERIEDWHRKFRWKLEYRKAELKPGEKPEQVSFIGAPAPLAIIEAAYGEKADDKLKKQAIERILPCIIDGKNIPVDIMKSAVYRATASVSLEFWEANKVRSIACALVCGYYARKGESITMGLDKDCSDRSYVFGRILACAEQVERHGQRLSGADANMRVTNAERLMVAFTKRPKHTTDLLHTKLRPYLDRIRTKSNYDSSAYLTMLSLLDRLGPEAFTDEPLSEKYLLGYASQKLAFMEKNKEYKEQQDNH